MPKKVKIPRQKENQIKENIPPVKNKTVNNPAGAFIEILKERFPDKLNFDVTESARILNLSYDFVREKILSGSILAKRFGDRYMINLFELARILTEGVK